MGSGDRRSISLQFLFIVTFLCQMIVGVVGLAVPIYATFLGSSPLLVGLIGSAGGLVYSFMPLVSGILSDKYIKKAFISGSLISYSLACLLYSLVKDPFTLIYIKVLEWLSVAAFWPAMEALIADTANMKLERALRRFNLSWGAAMVLGPIIGGTLISGWSIQGPFILSMLIALSFGLLSLIIIVEPSKKRGLDEKAGLKPIPTYGKKDSLSPALISIFLYASTSGILLALFPSYATDLGIFPYEIGLITFMYGVAKVVAFYQSNRLESRIGKFSMFLLGSLFIIFSSLLALNSYNTQMFMLCFLFFGFGSGVCYAASISFILGRWSSSKGYAAGVFESLIGLGYFVGSLIGGIVSEYIPNASFLFSLILSLAIFIAELAFKMKVAAASRHILS